MNRYVCKLNKVAHSDLSQVGGKASNLIRLKAIDEITVPEGFCIKTSAYRETFDGTEALDDLLSQLDLVETNDLDALKLLSEKIRNIIVKAPISESLIIEIKGQLEQLGLDKSYAVRSSGTAEDLLAASFAGQHDTYLNIIGLDDILEHIKKCWASLFTDRAIIYRLQKGFNHKEIALAVIVQEMIFAESSGVMFTADPMTSNRNLVLIDASYGLGENFVSGHVNSDHYRVSEATITHKEVSSKKTAAFAKEGGGTEERPLADGTNDKSVLTDDQIVALEKLGRLIEESFSHPQEIEWCILEKQIYIVQSRPVTTLFPTPITKDDVERLFISSGHLQMMTDPIKPLGMFFYKSVINNPPTQEIGGRLYLDLSSDLATFGGRLMAKNLLTVLGDTLLTSAVVKVIDDKAFIKKLPKGKNKVFMVENNSGAFSIMANAFKTYRKNDPDIVKELIDEEEKDIKRMGQELEKLSGDAVFDYISKDHDNRRTKLMKPLNAGVVTAAMLGAKWFDRKIMKWLGEPNAADSIIMSIPNSVTTDTGFSLLDVSDVIRGCPEVLEYLDHPNKKTFFEDIEKRVGGKEVSASFKSYLTQYGVRCSGDIDITVARWREDPTKLIPTILSNIKNFEAGESKRKFEEGKIQSEKKIEDLVKSVETLPGGRRKAKKIRRVASLIRNHIGYREYPKFSYMKRYYKYKMALLEEAKKLKACGRIQEIEDIYYLYFDEFRALVNGQDLDTSIISKRKKDYEYFESLTPPRVIKSDGEVIMGTYEKTKLPENAIPGVPVSAGVVEGRARVVKDLTDSYLSEGDILVTEFTDPSWTPTFVSIKGLITEVGGMSTHGAVIAREYGLPAVVSVENARALIKDGQLIRLNGTEGYIEIL